MRVMAEWGAAGVQRARAQNADVIVIVDVLSFSTAVDVAIGRAAEVVPFPYGDPSLAAAEALRLGARLAYPRDAGHGQLSLSPASLATLAVGARVLLPSPNGSALSHRAADGGAIVLAGCLRNADAVAAAAQKLAPEGVIAMVPAGERWTDGSLRPAIEDWLGAGVIVAALGTAVHCDAEATLMRMSAIAAGPTLPTLIRDCRSGRELSERGYAGDVEMALDVNGSRKVPRLLAGIYRCDDDVE